jgi:hypothetical protein
MSIAAERDFGWEREATRKHIPWESASEERQSSESKDPQPWRVEAEIARRLCCSSLTAPLWGMLGRRASSAGYFCFNGNTHSFSIAC